MKTEMPVLGDVMTASPSTIDINAFLTEAEAKMASLNVRHLPVMENGVVESIISDRDIKRFTLPGHKLRCAEELLVKDICPIRACVADVNDPLDKILEVMHENRLGAVIVLNDGELAGIFTETDACRLLSLFLKSKSMESDSIDSGGYRCSN